MFNNKNKTSLNRISLIDEFHSAITNIATMNTAKAIAEYSEQDTLQVLQQMNTSNGVYLTPNDIPDEVKDQLTKTSLDAHLKRVQSEQITRTAIEQVINREEHVKKQYLGKRLTLHAVDTSFEPFESAWVNTTSGNLSISSIKNRIVKGTVEDISFEKNLIILKPSYFSNLLTPRRKYYLIHVINTKTLAPAVSATG